MVPRRRMDADRQADRIDGRMQLRCQATTGVRRQEVLELKWWDIPGHSGRTVGRKTQECRGFDDARHIEREARCCVWSKWAKRLIPARLQSNAPPATCGVQNRFELRAMTDFCGLCGVVRQRHMPLVGRNSIFELGGLRGCGLRWSPEVGTP